MRYSPSPVQTVRILALSALLLAAAACNPLENKTQSMSYLVIENLMGLDESGKVADYVASDVLFQDPDTGDTSIIADIATATISARQLDPDPIAGTSPYADVQLTHYTVTFTRSDGRNKPGVDVPYPFDGDLTVLLKVNIPTEFGFIIVRESAKQEPPLLDLLQGGSRAEIIYTTATVDFYGHDLTGAEVKVSGAISVRFANFANG